LERSNYFIQQPIGKYPRTNEEIRKRSHCDLERDKLSLYQQIGIVNKDRPEEMSVAASLCQSVLDALTDTLRWSRESR
jgi:hypothetical protein